MKVESKRARATSMNTGVMVKIGMLAGVGVVLMLLDFPLPIFPSFLKMDLSDVPAIIGTFTMGTWAGVVVELVKNLLKIIVGSKTSGVGELANFLVGIGYIIPLGMICKRNLSKQKVILACLIASVSMALVGGLLNYYAFIPLYAKVLGSSVDLFVNTAAKINSGIHDLRTLAIYAIVPFNLLKGIVMSFVGFGLFKALQPLFKKL